MPSPIRLQRLVQSPKKKKKPKRQHSKLPEPTVNQAQGYCILFGRKGSGSAAAATTAKAKVNAHSSDDADDIVSQGATTEKLSNAAEPLQQGGGGGGGEVGGRGAGGAGGAASDDDDGNEQQQQHQQPPVHFRPFSVLGSRLSPEGISVRCEKRLDIKNTCFVDAARLDVISNGPTGATGESKEIYSFLGISADESFHNSVQTAITEPTQAKYRQYLRGSSWHQEALHTIHAVGPNFAGPNFAGGRHTWNQAAGLLAQTYANVLTQFAQHTNVPYLRLLPISGGQFAGRLKPWFPELTRAALARGFAMLSPGDRRDITENRTVLMCVRDATEHTRYQHALSNQTDQAAASAEACEQADLHLQRWKDTVARNSSSSGDSVKNLEPSSTSSAAPLGAGQQEDEEAADEETHNLPLLPAEMTWDESSEGLALHVAAEGEFDINVLVSDYAWFPSSFTLVQSSPWSGDVVCEDLVTRDASGNFIQSELHIEQLGEFNASDEELGDEEKAELGDEVKAELGDEEKAELEQQRLWDRWSIECAEKKLNEKLNEAIDLVGEHLGDEEEAGDSGEEVIDMGTTLASDRVQLAEGVRADIHFYDAMGRLRSRSKTWTKFALDLASCLGRVKGPAAVTPHLGKGQVGNECGVIAVYTCAYAILLSMGELGEAMPIDYETAPNGRYNEHVERLLHLFNVHF